MRDVTASGSMMDSESLADSAMGMNPTPILYRASAMTSVTCCGEVSFPDKYDSHIVVSFVNATLVLSIGETVEEVTDSGFLGTTPTLGCGLIGDDALLQVSSFHFKKV